METTLASGAKLVVTPASFPIANEFRKALMRAMRGMPISANTIDAELSVATSEEAEQAFFKCCERASYDGMKVSAALFDDPKLGDKARGDYHQIYAEVVKANVAPFFKQTFSVLNSLTETKAAIPE